MAVMQQLTQVPTDMLNSILSSIDSLDQSVLILKNANIALQKVLSTLQGICGVAFAFFLKLPPELRRCVFVSSFLYSYTLHAKSSALCYPAAKAGFGNMLLVHPRSTF